MSPEIAKSNKIRRIVRLRQMLQRWRNKAHAPPDVPAGHVALCVGTTATRFIVRATFLNHPIFRNLLSQAEEEYGFATRGPLTLPCDESVFEEILRVVARSEFTHSLQKNLNVNDFSRRCDGDIRRNLDVLGESGPLLRDFTEKSVC